jgi:hypothetical protein
MGDAARTLEGGGKERQSNETLRVHKGISKRSGGAEGGKKKTALLEVKWLGFKG